LITYFVIPMTIMVTLGAVSGGVWHRAWKRYWLASFAAAVTAGLAWVVGGCAYLYLAAPEEGFYSMKDVPYAAAAFAAAVLVALVPALLIGLLMRRLSIRSQEPR